MIDQALTLAVPSASYRNKQSLDWILAKKDEEETLEDFNDLMRDNHQKLFKEGADGARITALHLEQLKKKQYMSDGDFQLFLEKNPGKADETIMKMQEQYGQEALEKMQPFEFYNLYKRHATH